MLRADEKTHARICAMMQRVLIADPQPASAKLLAEVLRHICRCQIWTAPDAVRTDIMGEGIMGGSGVTFYDYDPGPGVIMQVPVNLPTAGGAIFENRFCGFAFVLPTK